MKYLIKMAMILAMQHARLAMRQTHMEYTINKYIGFLTKRYAMMQLPWAFEKYISMFIINAILQLLHCLRNGVTAVMHLAIDLTGRSH